MRKLALGLLAHVDAGKTTLSEALLYCGGSLRKLGRVDHRDAFLDTSPIERERGITIFSKQALLPLPELEITLLDTPGHADFSAEAERTLSVLDCALLVISGTDGIQGHTHTLWRLLERYGVPVFVFINKMDLPVAGKDALLSELRAGFGEGFCDFGADEAALFEEAALCGEDALGEYLETGALRDESIARLVASRRLFPCFFGSALRLQGVEELLSALQRFSPRREYPQDFGARVYKIARDPQGARLTYMKITGGSLRVKDSLTNRRAGLPAEEVWEEKVDQIRIYSGEKFRAVEEAEAGSICAVTGLSRSFPGQGLGFEQGAEAPALSPVLSYRLILPPGCDEFSALQKLRQLAEEDPQLHLDWNEQRREIHLRLMGAVQTEVLARLIEERFGLQVGFDAGHIVYKETIAAPAIGMGHFEPLRHYAEVHLLLEPLPAGSGLRFASDCSTDELSLNWQRLVLTHLAERSHPGVLIGAPITDMRISLLAGRAHPKHTEGGDFRQATYRALRQGLRSASCVLLEPWFDFRIELPSKSLGRAMNDLRRMSAELDPAETVGDTSVLCGRVPVSEFSDYASELASYTGGLGRLSCSVGGYAPCHNQAEVLALSGYDCDRDAANPADSVFCSHGSGIIIPWDEAPAHMHIGLSSAAEEDEPAPAPAAQQRRQSPAAFSSFEQDKELRAIFERTYGEIKRRDILPRELEKRREAAAASSYRGQKAPEGPEYVLVDGYNIIFAWDELKVVARDNLDAARQLLMDIMANYQGYRKCELVLVFDAYRVPRNLGEVTKYHGISVVYTREAETADTYIQKASHEISKKHRVRVATSDNAEQLIILGQGALRVSAENFRREVEQVNGEIAQVLQKLRRTEKSESVRAALEKAMKK